MTRREVKAADSSRGHAGKSERKLEQKYEKQIEARAKQMAKAMLAKELERSQSPGKSPGGGKGGAGGGYAQKWCPECKAKTHALWFYRGSEPDRRVWVGAEHRCVYVPYSGKSDWICYRPGVSKLSGAAVHDLA